MKTSTKFKHIRFLGAEGIGMSALIKILEEKRKLGLVDSNLKISKSDLAYAQNDPLHEDIDLVVCSTAIAESDSDLVELKKRGLEIWHRRDMLNFLSEGYKQIVVTGTHGKTTCSAMLAHILMETGHDPAFAVGGMLANYQTNGRAGKGAYFILEGDESDKSFTHTKPHLALVTCIEEDHLENYPGGIEEIKKHFFDFIDRAPIKVLNIDDRYLANYCMENECVVYSELALDHLDIKLSMPGKYNKMNALACIEAAEALGIERDKAIKALESFKGIKRRFELINKNYKGIKVYDDYAHHPTELEALINACKELNPKKMLFVYQPHHPERTKQFWNDFIDVFQQFPVEHECLIMDIYVARSQHIDGINSEKLVAEINKPNVQYLASSCKDLSSQGNIKDHKTAYKAQIDSMLDGVDYLFLVGAGDISKLVRHFERK